MDLPTEIIYEIACHIPFESNIWCLDKGTRAYWEKRCINVGSNSNKDVVSMPDFGIFDNISPDMTDEMLMDNLSRVRFLIVKPCSRANRWNLLHCLHRIEKNRVESINFCHNNILPAVYRKFKGINIVNYKFYIYKDDDGLIETHFPHYSVMYEQYLRHAKMWSPEDYHKNRIIWHLYITDGEVGIELSPGVLEEVIETLEFPQHITIDGIYYSDSVKRIFRNITKIKKFKTCILVATYEDTFRICKEYIDKKKWDRVIIKYEP